MKQPLLTSREPIINRRGFVRPTLTCLPFAPRDSNYYKMVSQIWEGVGDFYLLPIWERTKSFISTDRTSLASQPYFSGGRSERGKIRLGTLTSFP